MADYLKSLLGDSYNEEMSVDDISNALEKLGVSKVDEHENTNEETMKLKNLVSKRNAEIAKYKKELESKMSESEAKELERKLQLEEMQEKLKTLEEEKETTEFVSKFVSQGYDSESAKTAAKALMSKDVDTFLKIESSIISKREDSLKSQLMKGTPRPEGASNTTADNKEVMTKETLKKMSLNDRVRFAKEHPEEYNALYSKDVK